MINEKVGICFLEGEIGFIVLYIYLVLINCLLFEVN